MRTQIQFFLFISLIIIFSACRRELTEVNNTVEAIKVQDLNVPVSFDWKNSREIEIRIGVQPAKSYQPKSKISIFSNDPTAGGQLYLSGSASANNPFIGTLNLPPYIEQLYVVYESPYGSVKKEKIPILSGMLNYVFSEVKNAIVPKSATQHKSTTDGPDCETGCDQYISGGGRVNISGGQTYCVIDSFDGTINFEDDDGGGTLRVCGFVNLSSDIELESNSHIVIAEGGTFSSSKNIELDGGSFTAYQNSSVTIKDVELDDDAVFTVYENATVAVRKFSGSGSDGLLLNYGNISVQQTSKHKCPVQNYGTMEYNQNLEIEGTSFYNSFNLDVSAVFKLKSSGSSFENDGNLYVTKDILCEDNSLFTNNASVISNEDLEIKDEASFINNGIVSVRKKCNFDTDGDFTNNCQITAKSDISFKDDVNIVMNSGYLRTNKKLKFDNNQNVSIFDNCMIVAESMELDCSIIAQGLLSSIIVEDNISIDDRDDHFDGTVEVATTDGEINGNGNNHFTNGAYLTTIADILNYLPVTACNPEGIGTPTVIDTDFDGVIDNLDEYPLDPLRAFNSYFPDNENYATVAFEDLWPSQGDYDFNDLVISIYASYVSNADDLLVDLKLDFVVLAVGASLDNGFGFQLTSVSPEMVASVSGSVLQQGYVNIASNGLEADQSKAVVIVTESINDIIHRAEGSFFNTIPENPQGTSDTVNVVFTFNEAVDMSIVELKYFNPFVIKNKERGVEIHLPNMEPTNLADMSMLGIFDDASNPSAGIFYVSSKNLPWGMFLMEPFDYPVEKTQIIDAYLHFGAWAESGGTVYNDWYKNFSGYRNQAAIY